MLCVCDCGQKGKYRLPSLKNGHVKSCGCLSKEVTAARNFKHGQALRNNQSGAYRSWCRMITRCTNPSIKEFKHYGGKGISVCAEWMDSFESFYKYMGDRPKYYTIERIDSKKNYEPGNVRWATQREQTRNTTRSVRITANGETMLMCDWARKTGISVQTISNRINSYGWAPEDAVTKPPRKLTRKVN